MILTQTVLTLVLLGHASACGLLHSSTLQGSTLSSRNGKA
jgi:hypothetical protein